MRQSQYTLQFCAPAFLGNAEQSGQWRTPPFKAQLRQWWRVAYAASNQFHVNVEAMRREEGRMPPRNYDGERPRMPPLEAGRGLRRLSPEERVQLREQLRDGGRR